MQASYTLNQKEIGDKIQLPILKNTIPRAMEELFPALYDETKAVFEETFKNTENGNRGKTLIYSHLMFRPCSGRLTGVLSRRMAVIRRRPRNHECDRTNK